MGWFRGLQRLPLWGRGTALAVDAGMQVAGTALCDVLLCTIHHQSPTLRMFSLRENAAGRRRPVQLSPKGSPKNCLRRRLLLLLALAFLLTSCAHGAPRAPQIPADFAATVEVVRGDFTYSADYTRCGGIETLHFTAPDSLAGLCAATADGGCTLSVGGVTATVPTGGIFAPFALFDAPDGCLTESRVDGGLTVYAGRCGDDVYSIAVDGAGVPVRLSGSVGGSAAEIRVLKFAQISPPAGEEGNAHE